MERITRNNSAICLIDHQVGLLLGVRDITVAELKHNVVGLAKAAKILGMPIIASTTAKDVLWGPTFPELVAVLVVKIRRMSPRKSEVFQRFVAHSQGSICRIRSTRYKEASHY